MLVSILIPTRNRIEFLRSSLDSALAQRGVDVEVIVSDDGSTDGSVDHVRSVAARDARVRLLVDNPTAGIFGNVEHLIGAARGEAFTILGDDDLLDPEFCARLSAPMANDPTVLLTFCDHRTIDERGGLMEAATREVSRRYGRASLSDGPLAQPELVALRGGIWLGFSLYRRTAFQNEAFDRECGTAADWDYALRAARRGGVTYVKAVLGSYRDHRGTASRRGLKNEAELAMRVLSKHVLGDPAAESERRTMLRAAAGRNAYQRAAVDRAAARESLATHRELGGRPWAAHILAARALLALPPPLASVAHAVLSAIARSARGARRAASRR